jgi:hypothetical protein
MELNLVDGFTGDSSVSKVSHNRCKFCYLQFKATRGSSKSAIRNPQSPIRVVQLASADRIARALNSSTAGIEFNDFANFSESAQLDPPISHLRY